jgi:hypothetical protein
MPRMLKTMEISFGALGKYSIEFFRNANDHDEK